MPLLSANVCTLYRSYPLGPTLLAECTRFALWAAEFLLLHFGIFDEDGSEQAFLLWDFEVVK